MSNKFEKMSRKEITKFINKNSIEQEDMADLLEALQKMGLSSSITLVDDPNSAEGKVAQEYIQAHNKIPSEYYVDMPEKEIEWAKQTILNGNVLTEDTKKALIILAHVGRPDVYRTLEEYEKNSELDAGLKLWSAMAAKECRNFLESNIMDKPFIAIEKITKTGRNEPCPCGSGLKYKKCCGR